MAMVYITYFGAAMATINDSNTRIDFLSASFRTCVPRF